MSKRSRFAFLLLIPGILVLSWVVVYHLGANGRARQAKTTDDPSETSENTFERQNLHALNAKLDRLERVQGVLVANAVIQRPGSREENPAPLPDTRASPEDLRRLEREKFDTYFAGLDRRREQEIADPGWAKEVSARVAEVAGATEVGGASLEVTKVQCGASLCKVELTYQESAVRVAGDLLAAWARGLGVYLPEASVFNDEQHTRAVAYVSRAGVSLPPM